MSNVKEANININIKDLFFKWLDITRSWHNLNNQQQQLLALLLYYHYLYKQEITNEKILWKIIFDYDTKMKIKEDDVFDNNLSDNSFNNLLSQLRKKKVVVDNKIAPRFIPEIDNKSKQFKVIFNFNIVHND